MFWFSGSRAGAEGFLKVLLSVSLTMSCDFSKHSESNRMCRMSDFFGLISSCLGCGSGVGGSGGVKHQVAADALNFLARTEQPQDVPRTTNTPDLRPESEIL